MCFQTQDTKSVLAPQKSSKKLGARKTTGRHKSWRQAKQKTTSTIHKNPRLNTHQEMSAMPNTHSALIVSCQYTEAMHSALKNELLINESNLRSSELLKSLEIEGVSAQVIKMCVESADKAVLKQRAHAKASAHKILKGKSFATNVLTETAMTPIGKKNKHKKHKKDRKPRPLNAYAARRLLGEGARICYCAKHFLHFWTDVQELACACGSDQKYF